MTSVLPESAAKIILNIFSSTGSVKLG